MVPYDQTLESISKDLTLTKYSLETIMSLYEKLVEI